MRYQRIPNETVRRLPMYLRVLAVSPRRSQGYISSDALARELGLNSPQIRKDLSYFGSFGKPGMGYEIESLIEQIRGILKIDEGQKAAVVGAGRLGCALVGFEGFSIYGFEIAAIFDNSAKKIGKKVGKLKVEDVSKIRQLKRRGVNLGILAVPALSAQAIADDLVEAGVSGILNMTFCRLKVPKRVKVVTIDIAMELGVLPYYIK